MKVIAYRRVSTEQQASSGLGLDAQQAAITALCAREGYEVVSTLTDEATSGRTGLQSRPALLQALADIRQFGAEALIVAKIDRLSRDVLIQLTIEKELQRAGARLVSAAGEGTATDSPSDRLVRQILAAVAENEAAVISARTSAALQAKKKRGEPLGRPPLGMKIENNLVVPGDDFYLVVQILFARFKLKMTYHAIADLMTEQGDRNFTYRSIWNTCKRWGSQPGWYKGIESIEEIQKIAQPA